MNNLQPILTDEDHAQALREIEKIWKTHPPLGSPEANELEALIVLVDAYEAKYHPIDPPD